LQTFVPYSDYIKSHQSLDNRRLIKQNLETTQLLDAILNLPTKNGLPRKGWLNHPALVMWQNNPKALSNYLESGIAVSNQRGFKTDYCYERLCIYRELLVNDNSENPIWWGDESVHSSHRSRLLQKGYEELFKDQKNAYKTIQWYKDFDWSEMQAPELFYQEYKWPTNITSGSYDLEERVTKNALKIKQSLIIAYGSNPYAANIFPTFTKSEYNKYSE